MDWGQPIKKRRGMAGLQLAPLIDIFVLIIVFLIKGTVFGGISIEIPPGLFTPKSHSYENLESAPEIFVFSDRVEFKMISRKLDLQLFLSDQSVSEKDTIRAELVKYFESMPAQAKAGGVLVNLVADARSSYKSVYDVVKFLKSAGVQSVLFIAEGEQ